LKAAKVNVAHKDDNTAFTLSMPGGNLRQPVGLIFIIHAYFETICRQKRLDQAQYGVKTCRYLSLS
jgi:hypothetical protein